MPTLDKQSLRVSPPAQPGVILRGVQPADAERLRAWKNAHREFFFFKSEISSEDQVRWMAGYFGRPDDFMFIVEDDGQPVGCMGVRVVAGRGDIYNVILGVPDAGGRGVMSLALRLMIGFARRFTGEIGLKVLTANPAIRFYERNGLVVTADRGDHLEMKVDWQRYEPIEGS